jgi:hypothetical protein
MILTASGLRCPWTDMTNTDTNAFETGWNRDLDGLASTVVTSL